MLRRHAKDAFDHVRIADADLDVRFAPEAEVGVNMFVFREDATDRIEGLLLGLLASNVKIVDDSAIQLSLQQIFSSDVLRHLRAGGRNNGTEFSVDIFYGLDTVRSDQIQTVAEIDDGTHHERFNVIPSLANFRLALCRAQSKARSGLASQK